MSKRKVTMKGNPLTLLGDSIKVGDRAHDFQAIKGDLTSVQLSNYRGKKVLISIFPSIDTGVCALQTKRFNQEVAQLNNLQLINLSVDLPFALNRFCASEGINNAVTLSDHRDLDFGKKYGFVIEELRLLSRGVVLIDEHGIIQHVEYVAELTHEPNYDAVLKLLR